MCSSDLRPQRAAAPCPLRAAAATLYVPPPSHSEFADNRSQHDLSANKKAISGRPHNTPTQMYIHQAPSSPSSPSPIFSSKHTSSGYSGGTVSIHTSLLPSRPAPPSPSPAPSRRQSGAPSIRSRHRSGLTITSTPSSFKFGILKSIPSLLQFTDPAPVTNASVVGKVWVAR